MREEETVACVGPWQSLNDALLRMHEAEPVPVILFAYRRVATLRQVLEALKRDGVPLIIAFLDGARDAGDVAKVREVRSLVRAVDWCKTCVIERETNLGLGVSILSGMAEVFQEYESAIVFEDDIVCVPGTYTYLCDALNYYRDEKRVMSIGAYTHTCLRPDNVGNNSYFDGRFLCWGWASWRRSWVAMQAGSAIDMYWQCRLRGRDVHRYGTDLERQALREKEANIWAVRFCLLHILRRGLCLHPPVSLVQNIGFEPDATNTRGPDDQWRQEYMPKHASYFCPVQGGIREHPAASCALRKVFGSPTCRSPLERLQGIRWSIRPLFKALLRAHTYCRP